MPEPLTPRECVARQRLLPRRGASSAQPPERQARLVAQLARPTAEIEGLGTQNERLAAEAAQVRWRGRLRLAGAFQFQRRTSKLVVVEIPLTTSVT